MFLGGTLAWQAQEDSLKHSQAPGGLKTSLDTPDSGFSLPRSRLWPAPTSLVHSQRSTTHPHPQEIGARGKTPLARTKGKTKNAVQGEAQGTAVFKEHKQEARSHISTALKNCKRWQEVF